MASTNQAQDTNSTGRKAPLVVTERDIVFNCPTCQGELVVDREGAGLEVPCSHCGHRLVVPAYQPRPAAVPPLATAVAPPPVASASTIAPALVSSAPAATPLPGATEQPATPPVQRTFNHDTLSPEQLARRLGELKHQLKENRSQDTEMRGHVNRATIELHRLQLRLKTLQERHGDIQAELASIEAHTKPQGAA